ncbi:MAG TPA: ion channel [Flexivirga sp.]|uniref:ion channel n=1 Tax=Flexivirga sp. TaxID=1962927 RepID=UPI002D0A27FA|nr:ion channel [Flexivirga sp.]HWC20938.1 ion channel [Flexivirga sp.]
MATHQPGGLTSAPRGHLLQQLRALPSAILLIVQLLGILVYPFTAETSTGRTVFSLFQLVVLGLAVAAVRLTPALTWVSLCIGAPAAVLTVLTAFLPDSDPLGLASDVTHAIFYFYTAYALIRYMFSDNDVTRDEMFATGACFTVVAWGFAYVYAVVQTIWGPGQFVSGTPHELRWVELLFLSFTTMTNTGLSDIVPGGGHARSVMMLEQLAGVNYVALVVARLMGLTLARFQRKPDKTESAEGEQ